MYTWHAGNFQYFRKRRNELNWLIFFQPPESEDDDCKLIKIFWLYTVCPRKFVEIELALMQYYPSEEGQYMN